MHQSRQAESQDVFTESLAAAIQAPSSHNTQPWRFRLLRDTLDLIADRTRALPANDPYDRELTLSCGAALFNLRVAAAARSWTAMVDEFPFPDDVDLLARIHLYTGAPHGMKDALRLAAEIPRRRTYRKRFLDDPVPQSTIDALVLAAEQEQVFGAPVVSVAAREVAADLIADADEIQWADPVWRREISSWMHPQRRNEGFGIPGLPHRAAELVARSFDLGAGVAARDREILAGSPLLFVIGSAADSDVDWLRAGQGMQRVLLTACAHGLQASFLDQPLHIPRLRERVQSLAPAAHVPQVLLRLGKPADTLAPVVRRPVSEVLSVDPLER